MDFNPFKHKISELTTLVAQKGRVLIAEPFMLDPYFKRSVVLLTEHSKQGAVGFILNQPLGIQVQEVLPDFILKNAPNLIFKDKVNLWSASSADWLIYKHNKNDDFTIQQVYRIKGFVSNKSNKPLSAFTWHKKRMWFIEDGSDKLTEISSHYLEEI